MAAPAPVVCVLGMHRSGSSLVAEVLHRSGLSAGRGLIRPSASNPRGHFEDRALVDANKRILLRFGGSWDRPPALPEGWLADPRVRRERARVRRRLEPALEGRERRFFKDPRSSLLVPFWREALGPLCFVVTVRNREDVVRSLLRRHARWRSPRRLPWRAGRALAHGLRGAWEPVRPLDAERARRLWSHYYARILETTRDAPRTVVAYERLLADPPAAVRALLARVAPEARPDWSPVDARLHHGRAREPDAEAEELCRRLEGG